ncbi:MAG: hypothetical protein GF414_00320 [Candidatus Altiarchaeales archaeon]|nr:hypothetical protein [Candidatus Altiarchaeales archaeon]
MMDVVIFVKEGRKVIIVEGAHNSRDDGQDLIFVGAAKLAELDALKGKD